MKKIEIINNESTKSEIVIDYDLTKNIYDYLNENKKYFLITNTTLAKLYPDIISKFEKEKVIVIKDGEKYKNFETYNFIMNELLKNKIERKDAVIALGGGVVGDLAGFCASSILRGVELIQIPTTLLAMCDSSIGGKTGYNTKYGKNLIGSFYKAKKVLIDLKFLNTLNDYELKCGMGEVLKYAFIENSCKSEEKYDLMEFLSENPYNNIKEKMNYIVSACASLKVNVVKLDEKESGLRKVLNFGHTFAHPIESLTGYNLISHGQAVAYGIKMASKLACANNLIDNGYYERINLLIDKFHLADEKLELNKDQLNDFISLMTQDKKVQDGKINLLLPVGYAQVGLFDSIDLPSIEALLP